MTHGGLATDHVWGTLSQQEQGGIVVIIDMLLSVVTVITNLVTISAIREQEHMNMFHILLANLTISNLVSSVLVTMHCNANFEDPVIPQQIENWKTFIIYMKLDWSRRCQAKIFFGIGGGLVKLG